MLGGVRRAVAALAVGAVGLGAGLGVAPAVTAPAAAETSPVTNPRPGPAWTPCAEDATAQCATLRLPVDWSRPHGQQFDLALARRPAGDAGTRVGPLLVVPGGPGGSGVDLVLKEHGYFSSDIHQRFDLVGFDPRGVGRSHPVVCSTELVAGLPDLPASQADFDRRRAFNRRLRDDCRSRTGPLFDHLDTRNVVRDMDAVRAALGEEKLTYYGRSYSTLFGQQYAERYPNRVRALALDSTVDHSLATRDFLVTQAATTQDSFDEFVRWCAGAPKCALAGRDVRAVWSRLLARAARNEVASTAGRPVRPAELVGIAFSRLYGPEWSRLAEEVAAADAGQPVRLDAAPDPTTTPTVAEPLFAIACADWNLPIRDYREFTRYLAAMERVAPDMRYSPFALTVALGCQGLGPATNPQHRLDVRGTATPLLLANAVHDPATGLNWATNVARQLGSRATLLVYEGWGHGVYGRGDCTTGAIDRYLITRATPAPGTTCPAVAPAVDR